MWLWGHYGGLGRFWPFSEVLGSFRPISGGFGPFSVRFWPILVVLGQGWVVLGFWALLAPF